MTSPVEEIDVTCPSCGKPYRDWLRRSVNADLDPELAGDANYLRGMSETECPACGHRVTIEFLLATVNGGMSFEQRPEIGRVRVAPSVVAWDEHPQDFRALADELSELGGEVTLDEPPAPPPEVPQAAGIDVLIYLGDASTTALIALAIEQIIRFVARPRRGGDKEAVPVMAVIYGPKGEILREVAIDPLTEEVKDA